jgi:Fe-S-cluster containining protein
VPVDQATVDRLRARDWGAEPFEAPRTTSETHRVRLVERRCFFLDQENRCRIHKELSYEAKPAVCRAFPLAVLDVAGQPYARLSYWCPTVTANRGKPLVHQLRWLNETASRADRRTAPLRVNESARLTLRDFERVHRVLCGFMLETARPVGDGLAAAAGLIRRLNAAVATEYSSAVVERVVHAAQADGTGALAFEVRRQGHVSGGRRVLSLYLLQEGRLGRGARLVRFLSVLAFNLGIARLRSHTVAARAGWADVRGVEFDPPAGGAELLRRFLHSKIESRRYVAGDATLVTGFNILVAAYGVVNLLARMRAACESRLCVNETDVQLAVGAADFLVVEHRSPDRGWVRTRLTEAALGSVDLCGDVLAYLEGRSAG